MILVRISILILVAFSSSNAATGNVQNLTFNEFEKTILEVNSDDTLRVINFWATWCGPCVKELPYFEKINREKRGMPIEVILVSLDFEKNYDDKLLPFIQENELQSRLVWLEGNMNTENINRVHSDWSGAIPATLFMKNGKILKFIERELDFEELENTINDLL